MCQLFFYKWNINLILYMPKCKDFRIVVKDYQRTQTTIIRI